jgi:hypothetical protein
VRFASVMCDKNMAYRPEKPEAGVCRRSSLLTKRRQQDSEHPASPTQRKTGIANEAFYLEAFDDSPPPSKQNRKAAADESHEPENRSEQDDQHGESKKNLLHSCVGDSISGQFQSTTCNEDEAFYLAAFDDSPPRSVRKQKVSADAITFPGDKGLEQDDQHKLSSINSHKSFPCEANSNEAFF